MRKEKGITLIALVITVIVLLILAAVSITALTDEDKGVVTKAKQAAKKTEDAADDEDSDIQEILDYADSNIEDEEKEETGFASKINANNYGDYVNYNKDIGSTLTLKGETSVPKTDWRIFFEDDNRVYLISADCVRNTSSLLKLTNIGMTATSNYLLHWASVPSSISSTVRQDNLFKFTYTLNANNASSICTSKLLDTALWSNFVDASVADYAIGGPTIEMYAKSWNAKGYSTITPTIETTGYKVNGDTYVDMSSNTGFNNNLYYPHNEFTGFNDEEIGSYWLAAPSAEGNENVMVICFDGWVDYGSYYSSDVGVRPVIALKEGINAEKDANGIWQLSE